MVLAKARNSEFTHLLSLQLCIQTPIPFQCATETLTSDLRLDFIYQGHLDFFSPLLKLLMAASKPGFNVLETIHYKLRHGMCFGENPLNRWISCSDVAKKHLPDLYVSVHNCWRLCWKSCHLFLCQRLSL